MFLRRSLLILIVLVALPASFALAQTPTETNTPAPTATPSPTPTNAMAVNAYGVPVGTILLYGGQLLNENSGWLLCNGENVSRTTYSQLFATYGTIWGAGDGSSTFTLPNCESKFPVGYGQGSGLSFRNIGTYLGAETHTLTITELPPHSHTGVVSPNNPVSNRAVVSSGGIQTVRTAGTSDETGGGAAFDIMNPAFTVLYLIWSGVPAPESSPGGVESGPTPTPDGLMMYSTVEVNGTPQPVAIRYEITAGDSIQTILLFLLCGLTILGMVLRARENHK